MAFATIKASVSYRSLLASKALGNLDLFIQMLYLFAVLYLSFS